MRRALLLAAAFALLPPAAAAAAHGKTQTLTVRGAVSQDCTLTTYALTFPSVGVGYIRPPNRNPVLAQSSLGVRCTKGSVVQIAMNSGLYGTLAGAQFGSRSMKSSDGRSYLGYELCHDAACTSTWSPAGYAYTSSSEAGSTLAVWGRIVTGQKANADAYTDSITVTVSF
jgi:spore coat protein U-like protein